MESSEVYKSYIKDIDMNKMKLALLVAGSLVAGASTSAFAEGQGTIEFNGKLFDETCTIKPGDEKKVVDLDAVSVQTLTKATDEGGYKPFDITVNCSTPISSTTTPNLTQVAMNFEPTGETTDWDATTGNLMNVAPSGAKNVQVKIISGDNARTHIKIGDRGQWVTPDSNGDAVFKYFGGYYATGKTEAGPVNAKVMYTLVYQ
ncbi:TPA: type 1 fimbrial protein [Morganella morganii]|jgi:major type 1 subunit fimbrin (pilin)|nr:type 1 fimbrial protein [Morganella morganii]